MIDTTTVCQECDFDYSGRESCPYCEQMKRFSELERNELRLEDELSERLSELNWYREGIKKYEDAVEEARKNLGDNQIALRDFNWIEFSRSDDNSETAYDERSD